MATTISMTATKRPSSENSTDENRVQIKRTNGLEVNTKRLLGAFYTPDILAGILVHWAMNKTKCTILDPSFGGCAFLVAAIKELACMGVKDPGRAVYGVDIDPSCIDHVRAYPQLLEDNCIFNDFLALAPDSIPGAPFQAIVGNPPFVRHHWLKGDKREAARSVIRAAKIKVPETASTWAYFILHSLAFLEQHGRLAMLVPEAILQADYAIPIREVLSNSFSSVSLIHIRHRFFEATDEPVVVLAATGYGRRGRITIESIEDANDLVDALSGSTPRRHSDLITNSNGRIVSNEILKSLIELERHTLVRHVAEIASVRIGIVTGANKHFIRSAADLERLGVPSDASYPVVVRTRWLSGIEFTKDDHRALIKAGRRAFLVHPTQKNGGEKSVQRWIDEGETTGIQNGYKCSQRKYWYQIELPAVPDAFASCTRLGSPILVLNSAMYFCSNTLHSVYWNRELGTNARAVAVGFLTSLVSVWAELTGRRYGGGVLKIEPSILSRAPVPVVPGSENYFAEINSLLRAGREEDARFRADEVVLRNGLGLSEHIIRYLQRARLELITQRRPVS